VNTKKKIVLHVASDCVSPKMWAGSLWLVLHVLKHLIKTLNSLGPDIALDVGFEMGFEYAEWNSTANL